MSLNYVWGRAQCTLQWAIQMQIGFQLSIIFSIRTWWTNFFSIRLRGSAGEVKHFMKLGTKWLESEIFNWFRFFCLRSKRYLFSVLQMSQNKQDASASIIWYWFRGERNLQFSENMFFLSSRAVQTNKAKALGGRYRVDLTLCFFTYRVEQIVDYNCKQHACGSFCVFLSQKCRKAPREVFDCALSAIFILWWLRGCQKTYEELIRIALQLIRCLRILITANVDWITEKASSDEATIRPERIHA